MNLTQEDEWRECVAEQIELANRIKAPSLGYILATAGSLMKGHIVDKDGPIGDLPFKTDTPPDNTACYWVEWHCDGAKRFLLAERLGGKWIGCAFPIHYLEDGGGKVVRWLLLPQFEEDE